MLENKYISILDIETIIDDERMVWIVTKNNPNKPLLRISYIDFNFIIKGYYNNSNIIIVFNGKEYKFNEKINQQLKKILKDKRPEIRFSFQEFLNEDIISNIKLKDNIIPPQYLNKKTTEVKIICNHKFSSKIYYQKLYDKIKEKFDKTKYNFNKLYFMKENFFESLSNDLVTFNRTKIILSEMFGKIENDKIENINEHMNFVEYFTTEQEIEKIKKESQNIFEFFYNNCSSEIKNKIKNFFIDEVFFKLSNSTTYQTEYISLKIPRDILTYESFTYL